MINIKTVYGPVPSWRLGKSLGIDLICSKEKICTFNCIYCQLGNKSKKIAKRKNYISIEKMKLELIKALNVTNPEVITFSGMGEPTLANNMDSAIKTIRNISNIPIAILTNSTLMNIEDIRKTLSKIDIVVAKIDAPNEKIFQIINQPANNINFKETIDGIREFRKIFKGKLALQIMFMDKNMKYANEIAQISKNIEPDEVQINTPLRISPIKPLSERQIDHIEKKFKNMGLKTISVYKSNKPKISPLDKKELIERRRNEL